MPTHTKLLLSGLIFPDINHERLFLLVRHGTHIEFKGGIIAGDRELRLIDQTPSVLRNELFENRAGSEFSILAHVATKKEISFHDQLTQPTLTVEGLVAFADIQRRAFEIFQSDHGGPDLDNWLRAERELLGVG